jgi:GMP synthase (glutamine-hydrolysing)
MWAACIGLTVKSGNHQFGVHDMTRVRSQLFVGCPMSMPVLQSHGDEIREVAKIRSDAFRPTGECQRVMAAGEYKKILFGVQFHPEVTETVHCPKMFSNFVFRICKAKNRFPVKSVARRKVQAIRKTMGTDGKVLLALSGGSDSSVCAYLLKKARLGAGRVHAVYIRGIDRPDDEAFVLEYFSKQKWLTLEIVDATQEFLTVFKGVESMKQKRIAMRSVYKPILEQAATSFGATHICQGTLYTDISESGGGHDSGARKSVIKLHHNTNLGFALPELLPLVDCVKDSARDIGREIGVPEALLTRHPFPGPGQAVRNEGEINEKKLTMSRQADGIWIDVLRTTGYYSKVWQAGAVVTKSEHTTTKGDEGGLGLVIGLWAVWSVNGFTAQAAELPWWLIKKATRRIGNEVKGVGAVVYRTSDKPFSTIEWG